MPESPAESKRVGIAEPVTATVPVWVVVWRFRSWEEQVRVYVSEPAARAAVIAGTEMMRSGAGAAPADLTFDAAVAAWNDAGHSVAIFGPESVEGLIVPVQQAPLAASKPETVMKAERAARLAAKRQAHLEAKAAFESQPDEQRRAQEQRLATLLETAEWRFARTMPQNPHWYTLRKTWPRDEDFIWAVEQIRLRGYRHKFRGTWYVQIDVNDHVYWTMGWPIGSLAEWGWERLNKAGTILINRKPLAPAAGADSDMVKQA